MALNQKGSPDPALGNLENLLPELEALYKDVHSHPELSMQETRTSALAADRLRAGSVLSRILARQTKVLGQAGRALTRAARSGARPARFGPSMSKGR